MADALTEVAVGRPRHVPVAMGGVRRRHRDGECKRRGAEAAFVNAPDGEHQTERWAKEAYVIRLTPTGETPEAPGRLPDDYASVRPVPSPATTTRGTPSMAGARRRRPDR